MSKFNLRNLKFRKDPGLLKESRKITEEHVEVHPDEAATTEESNIDNSAGKDFFPDEPDEEINDIKTIQEFIDLKKKQNQILEKLLESINKTDKQV